VLSRTLVPTLALYLLKAPGRGAREDHAPGGNPLARLQRGFANGVVLIRAGYRVLLEMAMARAKVFAAGFLAIMVLSVGLVPFLGRDFFPSVDSGQITLHVRGPVGMRLEEASVLFGRIEDAVRETIPAADLGDVIDNVGIPNSAINLVYSNSGVIGAQDGDVFISLKRGHKPTADYVRGLREILPRQFPGTTFSFLPADIISQILNFGAPAPIDIQVSGPDAEANRGYATDVLRRLRQVRGLADIRLQQPESAPQFGIDVDRQRMSRLGLTERDVTNSLVTALAGSSQVAPNFWLDPQNGVSYPIVAQVPQYWLTSLPSLENLPITGPQGQFQVLGGLATVTRERAAPVVSHHDIQPVIDIFATPQDRDLGAVTADIRKILKDTADALPKGAKVVLRGQAVTMDDAFSGLVFGIVAAVALIYLLIVVNFQSWLDPFVIVTALPAALAGICWMLFATGTTVSVPALTGAIMCMGVATANSILVISFARERLLEVGDATQAAIEAGFQRFRPVVMTALAMIIGMTPMALGLGDGGEQNAPLGRAVIGGLLFATTATLFFVPVVFSLVHGRRATAPAEPPAVAAPGGSHA
jgi:multidrug efflux pump subunit AcrB